jgi:hypothetical protein
MTSGVPQRLERAGSDAAYKTACGMPHYPCRSFTAVTAAMSASLGVEEILERRTY